MKKSYTLTARMRNILETGFEVNYSEQTGELRGFRKIFGGHIVVAGKSFANIGEARIDEFRINGSVEETELFEGTIYIKAERLGKGRLWISL